MKGTAGTIGLKEVEEAAGSRLLFFSDSGSRRWTMEEWEDYLKPCLTAFKEDHSAPAGSLHEESDRSVRGPLRQPNKVLIIDDDVELVAFLKESLENQDYYVSIALTAERGITMFYESRPDMILLDIKLPDKSGMEVLAQIIGKAKKERTPVIIVSEENSKMLQMRAYALGAMDFIPKPIDFDLLLIVINNRFRLKAEWLKSIVVDELTGAYNRKHFNQMMKQLISDYKRSERIFSLAMLDLDHFKRVNDTFGHLIGDEVLQTFSEEVRSSIRVEDTFCRYGGEEFALFLPNTSVDHALVVIQRIQERFAAIDFYGANETFHVTFSSGITQIKSTEDTADVLVGEADQALYASKNAGRNRTTLYTEHLSGEIIESVLNVMVIDDEALIRKIITTEFSSWKPNNVTKVSVRGYGSGLEFLQSDWYSKDEKYIILLDGVLPDLDGIEVLERIRNNYPQTNILIIMLTGRNNQADIVHALQTGADDYVIKPFHMKELLLRIERLAFRTLY
ncbi:diguanylate cyclase [Paenibacillus sp. sgz500958]|uniref:GGDEF domain-containing response regulator n=1 Tax=Paenibacillus sp. sgz500958 TaxID=3242475 RepID=UPI0036D38B2C